jgi:hypothetical protein
MDEYGERTCGLITQSRRVDVLTVREPQQVWWDDQHAIVSVFEVAYTEERTLWAITTIGVTGVQPEQSNYREATLLKIPWSPLRSLIGL